MSYSKSSNNNELAIIVFMILGQDTIHLVRTLTEHTTKFNGIRCTYIIFYFHCFFAVSVFLYICDVYGQFALVSLCINHMN